MKRVHNNVADDTAENRGLKDFCKVKASVSERGSISHRHSYTAASQHGHLTRTRPQSSPAEGFTEVL